MCARHTSFTSAAAGRFWSSSGRYFSSPASELAMPICTRSADKTDIHKMAFNLDNDESREGNDVDMGKVKITLRHLFHSEQ